MNERIRELVRQAVESVDIVTGNESLDDELAKMYIPDCFSEKFAELIVKECAGVCHTHGWGMLEHGMSGHNIADDCGTLIKEHFGVEE
jgi:hypothetical protein